MRPFLAALLSLLASSVLIPAALAQDLPQGPKAPPPDPLPEPLCDVARPDSGDWLVGRWVMPYGRWEIRRDGKGLTWTLDQKPNINASLGWKDGARLDGRVEAVSACTLRLVGQEGAETVFSFDGVSTDDGRIYGYAMNRTGQKVRWTLRRER
jgi:hypothetical protein